jgi:hypothetical protein
MGKRYIGIAGSEFCCGHYGCSLLSTIAYCDDFLRTVNILIKVMKIYGMTIILTEQIFGEE